MLDLHFVREHAQRVTEALEQRGMQLSVDRVLELDEARREKLTEVQQLQRERNETSKQIGQVMKSGGDATPMREAMKRVGERISALEEELGSTQEELQQLLGEFPNIPHSSVPVGQSAEDNPVVRTHGKPPEFDFEPKAHWDVGTELGILDFERAAKLSGARFALYFGDGALLERALIQFMLDLHTLEHGYTEVLPPFMVNAQALYGTGQLPKFAQDLFKVEQHDLYLVPTAEVPITNIHADEILDGDALPIAYCAYTPCFRSEAGSYGKDVRGLIRQHQFNKVELVRFSRPEDSYAQLDQLTTHAEEVLKRLGLHYRIVDLCTGDLGFHSAKTYDLEVWVPSQETYREISSCSNFEAFQARRAKIRYRASKNAKPAPLHTLNGSGLAIGRTLVAILENYQKKDGSVEVPEVLRGYMGGKAVIGGGHR